MEPLTQEPSNAVGCQLIAGQGQVLIKTTSIQELHPATHMVVQARHMITRVRQHVRCCSQGETHASLRHSCDRDYTIREATAGLAPLPDAVAGFQVHMHLMSLISSPWNGRAMPMSYGC